MTNLCKLQMAVESNHPIALVSVFRQSFENRSNHAELSVQRMTEMSRTSRKTYPSKEAFIKATPDFVFH